MPETQANLCCHLVGTLQENPALRSLTLLLLPGSSQGFGSPPELQRLDIPTPVNLRRSGGLAEHLNGAKNTLRRSQAIRSSIFAGVGAFPPKRSEAARSLRQQRNKAPPNQKNPVLVSAARGRTAWLPV